MIEEISLQQLFALINPKTTVVTPNRRLAATLQQLFSEKKLLAQESCWKTPDILPFLTWIQRLWQEYVSFTIGDNLPQLLTPSQESYLWGEVISQSDLGDSLLRPAETADLAHAAWKLVQEWRVNLSQLHQHASEDSNALHAWATAFNQQCAQKNLLDSTQLLPLLCQVMASLSKPSLLIFIGFNEFTPQQQYFIKKCELHGVKVKKTSFIETSSQCLRISFISPEDEIVSVALWAKQQFNQNPGIRIGCVIPNLDKVRDRVADIFCDVFRDIDEKTTAFNISAGRRLLEYPLIQAALQLFLLNKPSFNINNLSYLLTSPFLGDAEREYIHRAQFDVNLRRANISVIHLKELIGNTTAESSINIHKRCPLLAKRLQAYVSTIENTPSKQSFSDWSNMFAALLKTMGWPGERSLNSEEYQIVDHWLRLLTTFSTLEQVSQPISYFQAAHVLQRLAATTIFQPHSPATRIQVLGLLEAASLPFDALWVTGLDDVTWPPQASPNPFIPKSLQRELNMPHANALRELQYCQQLTRQFQQSAQQVYFSYAQQHKELERHCSPLIREIPEINVTQLVLDAYQAPSELLYQTKNLETLHDEQGPPINTNETVHGGVSILKQQALCPFKAFAEWRLYASPIEAPLAGLRAKDRGSLVHKALELVWKCLKDQHTLCQLTESELQHYLNHAVDEAVQQSDLTQYSNTKYLELEKARTKKLLREWLALEAQRPSFTVLNCEASSSITLNKMTLTIRIDRIDQLANGHQLIIDYKTGKNNDIYRWLGDRLEEPQLPLYSLLDSHNTAGISFAQICPGNQVFKGISKDDLHINGILNLTETRKFFANSWDELVTKWRTVLEKLSDDYTSGYAAVDPKDPPATCEYCSLQPLCRINEEAITHVA